MSITYNSQGLAETITDALGGVTHYGYDATGNVLMQADALDHATLFTYDPNGNRTSQTASRTLLNGSTETLITTFDYDKLNRLTKVTYADGTTTQAIYNKPWPAGNHDRPTGSPDYPPVRRHGPNRVHELPGRND